MPQIVSNFLGHFLYLAFFILKLKLFDHHRLAES